MYARLLSVLVATVLCSAANAQSRAEVEAQFRTWLETDVRPAAEAAGVSRSIFDGAFESVTLDWDLPGLMPPGSDPDAPRRQRQAEFGAPAAYFAPGIVEAAASEGRRMATRHAALLAETERSSGVPGHIVLGIWGRESAYGRAAIAHDVFRVLATRGFMGLRRDYFAGELVAALQIAEARHIPEALMKSSQAGALGQPQFMPSNFLAYATDGDGDGRADIWRSDADTIASIATYLDRHGWVAGRDWGFEVIVPPDVSCALEGPDQGRAISDWEAMGIRRTGGRDFPAHERAAEGYLMMPAGRLGPAFVVTPNFYVLKEYNTSDLYALFVGHVGDRIAFGSKAFAAQWQPIDDLYRSDIARLQRGLEALGHDVGGADGLPGFRTRRSIGRWQAANGRAETCFPDRASIAALVP
ncbi:lytic murein transglycosylase [Sulfitobacter sp. LCG007]